MALLMLLTAVQSLAFGLGPAFPHLCSSLIKSQLPTKRDWVRDVSLSVRLFSHQLVAAAGTSVKLFGMDNVKRLDRDE